MTERYFRDDEFLTEFAEYVDWGFVVENRAIPKSLIQVAYPVIKNRAEKLNWALITRKNAIN